jgi:flavodoxin
MRLRAILLAIVSLMLVPACAEAEKMSPAKKILVTYFSQTGNTREIALQIAAATGADVFEIVPEHAYPADYSAVVEQAKRELRSDFRPKLKTKAPNLGAYDVVFVGSPCWWGTVAPPVMTFLESQSLSGKTLVPFMTHEGSGMGKSIADIERLSPGAKVLDGKPFRGSGVKGARGEVIRWLKGLGLVPMKP